MPVAPDDGVHGPPVTPYQGLDHFGLTVSGIDAVAAELKGKGAEFIVQLPISAAYQSAQTGSGVRLLPGMGADTSGAMPSLAGLRVLLVDDEPDAREMIAAILSEAGAEVISASGAKQAFDLVAQRKPDALISDISMPGEDGYELIRKIRTLSAEQGGQLPAIALTAYARTQDRLKVLSAGYQMHVTKPVEPVELATVVASLTKRL